MSQTLQQIAIEFKTIAVQLGQSTEVRPLNVVRNDPSFPSITFQWMASRARSLGEKIERIALKGIPAIYESVLVEILSGIQNLKSTGIPNVLGFNPHAIFAYLASLDEFESFFQPFVDVTVNDVDDAQRALYHLKERIEALTLTVGNLEPSVENFQTLAKDIIAAHEAADRLPLTVQALNDAQNQVTTILSTTTNAEQRVNSALTSTELNNGKIKDRAEDAANIIKKCQDALRHSTSVGLAGAFNARAESLQKSVSYWLLMLIIALSVAGALSWFQVHDLIATIQDTTPASIVWTRVLLALMSVGGSVWLAWLSTKQIGQRFRLAEDYAYKASISSAYEGYRDEAVKIDNEFLTKLFASALTRFDEQPLRFVENENHGSPWHEFMNSKLFKHALKIAPELPVQFAEMAKKTIDSAQSQKKTQESTMGKLKAPIDSPPIQ